MKREESLVERFESQRPRLRAIAYRILGSLPEAEDAVQEAWIRLRNADINRVENLEGWLTTVTARICLDMLRARKSRREESLEFHEFDRTMPSYTSMNPEAESALAESVGLALLVVLKTLTPAERVAFVLHDVFEYPFDAIAPIVQRSTTATRQLASRARRRVQGTPKTSSGEIEDQQKAVNAFLEAAREGNVAGLIAVLDPDVELRADASASPSGLATEIRGAESVAKVAVAFSGRARFGQIGLVNGAVGIIVAPRGDLQVVLEFTIANGKVVKLEVVADPTRLNRIDLAVLQ